MKKITLYQIPVVLAVGLLVSPLACDFGRAEEKDPFTREKEAAQEADPRKPETTVVIGIQLAEVPAAKIREWDEGGLTGNEWRERVQTLVDAGEAAIVDSVAGTFWSGNRGRFQSVMKLRYPTSLKVIDETGEEPLFPETFGTKNLGIYFELDPLLNVDHDELELNFAFEWSRYLGETPGSRTATERVQATDVREPLFSTQRVNTQTVLPIGEYQVLTRIEPNDVERRDAFDIIVFGRADLVIANPVADTEAVESVEEMVFRATWAEVDADSWHNAIHETSLSAWFGGDAWKKVMKWEEDGSAKILASPSLVARNGQRAKVEIAKQLQYQDSFPVPGAVAESDEESVSVKMATAFLGEVMEVDAIMGTNGIVHFNHNSTSTSMHGYSVSHRKLEENDWVPSVQFPELYESSVTTQVFLGEDSDMLVGVGTPPLENGQPDTSKKWLFFLHNDTFDTE